MLLGIDCSPGSPGRTFAAVEAILDFASQSATIIRWADADTHEVIEALSGVAGIVFGSPIYRARACWSAKEVIDHCPRGSSDDGFGGPWTAMPTVVVTTGASHHHHLASAELAATLLEFFAAWIVPPPLHLAHTDFDASGRPGDHLDPLLRSAAGALTSFSTIAEGTSLLDLRPQV